MTIGDVSWTIHTSPDGALTAVGLEGGNPTVRPGATERLRVVFDDRAAFETLREYVELAVEARVATMTSLTSQFYRELHGQNLELLVGVEPSGTDLDPSSPGLWGVLVGGRDLYSTVSPGTLVLDLTVFVLGEFADYADRSAVKTAHER